MRFDKYGLDDRHLGLTTPSLVPAALISVLDNAGITIRTLNEMDFFNRDSRAIKAKHEAENWVLNQVNRLKGQICGGETPNIPSFFTGSGPTAPYDKAKAAGVEINEYAIPQDPLTAMAGFGGLEWRVLELNVNHVCCEKAWKAVVGIIDSLGWDKAKYGENKAAEFFGGLPRDMERGRFAVTGRVNCCN